MAGRKYRPFIAVNLETGEKKEWDSTYAIRQGDADRARECPWRTE